MNQHHANRTALRRWAVVILLLFTIVALLAGTYRWNITTAAAETTPPGATERVKVQVPQDLRTGPFTQDRYLNVPPGFAISVYARIDQARFMAVAPNNDLFVSQPSTGKVLVLRPTGSGEPQVFEYATGMRRPHDIVFHTVGATTYVYIAETNQINRFVYTNGDTKGQEREVIITGLPDSSTPELKGSYGHELKNIALDGNDTLYVSIASTCNACESDTMSDPVRAAIYTYNADGTNRRLFAQGLRNAEGLDFVPGTNDLWVVVNNRDRIAYPFDDDWDGDGKSDYGKVMQSYVDDNPPDEFTRVRKGGNYGWPFCNPNPATPSGYNDMPFARDVQLNANGDKLDCNKADRIDQGIQAHSAPLGLTFLQDTAFPAAYRNGAVTGLHGSWNRSEKTGYKVAYFPWDNATQQPGDQVDLVTGWLNDKTQEQWGRPVDTAVDKQGNMFISDDGTGTIYKLSYTGQAAAGDKILFVRGGDGTGGLGSGNNSELSDINDESTAKGNHGWAQLAALLRGEGFVLEQMTEGPAKDNTPVDFAAIDLNQYDVIVLGSNNATYPQALVDAIEAYVRNGGGLLVISDGNWGSTLADAPSSDQQFLDRFGLVMNQDNAIYTLDRSKGDFVVNGVDRGDHPILQDVNRFDGEGVSPLTIAASPPADIAPVVLAKAKRTIRVNDGENGTTREPTANDGALVIAEVGNGRVAGHFDRNTFFNENGAGTNITRFDNAQYAVNLFTWLAEAESLPPTATPTMTTQPGEPTPTLQPGEPTPMPTTPVLAPYSERSYIPLLVK